MTSLRSPLISQRFFRWVLALSVACVLLAWPLHQAQHAAEAAASAGALLTAADAGGAGDTDDREPGQRGNGDNCAWCLFHGQHHVPGGTPSAFQVHAEADAPPLQLPQGLPAGRSELAASPRGPPAA